MKTEEEKILIVDDDPISVKLMKKMMADWGYHLLTAYGGIEAIKVARREKPDLLLLDVAMPDLTGYEVCRALNAHPDTTGIPVIFLTARGEIFDRVEGLGAGAKDYITKPFHPEELKMRIKTVLHSKREKELLKEEKDHLAARLIIDELTGFYNIRYFEERIREELSRAKRYNYDISLALISPDGYDEIKKRHSESRCDALIKQLAQLIKRNIRAIDIITRYGDGAFAVILPQTGKDGASAFGEKINKMASRHRFYGIPENLNVTVSVGISYYLKENIGDMLPLLNTTLQALKKARETGDRVVVLEI